MNKTNTIGFVGAIEVPLIKKFEAGFIQGAKYVKPDIKEIGIYVGGSNAFGDAAAGKAKAETLIQQKADVIYHAAGGTGLGVFQAAKEKGISPNFGKYRRKYMGCCRNKSYMLFSG